MRAFNVYLNGKKIDTVFYGDSVSVDREEVRRSLINHDGYEDAITVREDHGAKMSSYQPKTGAIGGKDVLFDNHT